jgi:ketosteroid isomerase-like protein
VSTTEDYVAIRRLQDAYADAITRRAFDELPNLFLPDATIVVDMRTADPLRFDGPVALGGFISGAMERFEFFVFVILNAVVAVGADGDPDAATGRMVISELRTDREHGRRIDSYGVYHDRYRRTTDGWRFAARRYHSLARLGEDGTSEVFPFPAL